MNTTTSKKSFRDDVAGLFSEGKLNRLKDLGHDFIESGNDEHSITDQEGKRYLDCVSSRGIFNLGRSNDVMKKALIEAVGLTDQGNFPMISIEKAALAEKIAGFVPGDLECTVFSVVRGESIDFACKLARGATGRKEFIALNGSWFGQTGFALSLSERDDAELYGPLIPEVSFIQPGDIAAAEKAITKKTAAVFLEPVQVEKGCRVLDQEYLKKIREICSRTGALLVIDETETGLGRCGEKFAFEKSGILPDILVIGESLGGGIFPIAATVFPQKLNKFMNAHPMIHLSTFGGSDIGCRVASAALAEYEKIKPWENTTRQGEPLLLELSVIMKQYQGVIEGLSGEGLLIALDLGTEKKALTFCRELATAGLLALPGDIAKHTVILRPGLLIDDTTRADIVRAVQEACIAMG